jgi:hypothetical protein
MARAEFTLSLRPAAEYPVHGVRPSALCPPNPAECTMNKSILFGLLMISSTATAGYHYAPEVWTSSTTSHHITVSAQGFCAAADKTFSPASCFTSDPGFLAMIASVNESSTISFTAIDGICTTLNIANGSSTF